MLFALTIAAVFPYHLRWSLPMKDQIEAAGLFGKFVYFGTFHDFGVADAGTGKLLWRKSLSPNEFSAGCVAGEGKLFLAPGKGPNRAYDLRTGKLLWTSAPKPDYSSIPDYHSGLLFLQTRADTLSALNATNGKPKWTYRFPVAKSRSELAFGPYWVGGKVLILDGKGAVQAVDAQSGKPLWRRTIPGSGFERLEVLGDKTLGFANTDAYAFDSATGRPLWKTHTRGNISAYTARAGATAVFSTDLRYAQAVDLRTGREVWATKLDEANERAFGAPGLTVTPNGLFTILDGNAHLLDQDGHVKMSGPAPVEEFQFPALSVGNDLVVFDSHEIHWLAAGAGQVASDKRPRIRELVAKVEHLSRPEKLELASYGTAAMDELIPAISKNLDAYLADTAAQRDSMQAFGRLDNLAAIAAEAMTPESTPRVLPLAERALGTEAESLVLRILVKGDDRQTLPLMLRLLDRKTDKREGSSVALEVVLKSRDPRAAAWKLKKIQEADLKEGAGFAIFPTLVDTCGPAGVAIAKKLSTITPRQISLAKRIDLGKLGKRDIVSTGKDARGTEWILFKSGVLGSYGDLWIAHRAGAVWVDPIFTGVNAARTSGFVSKKREDPGEDPKVKQLLAGGWLKTLVGNPELTRDSDNDGLTDLAEARLGTDPNRGDTDGDGVLDGVDENPTAARRSLSDPEMLIQRALEARYRFSPDDSAALLTLPLGLAPLEFDGRGGIVIYRKDGGPHWGHPLSKEYEQGVALITLTERSDASEIPASAPVTDRYIRWNATRTEGTVTISNYYGGLNGTGYEVTMRKVDGEWLVVKMYMAWIS